MDEEGLSIRVELTEEEKSIFLEVKKVLMMRNNTDVLRRLIKEKFDELVNEGKIKVADLSLRKEEKE